MLPFEKSRSLRESLAKHFVYPIAREADKVHRGGQLSEETPMSAIFFGPPGTSKTELAKIISGYLNWPLLLVDPSYVIPQGLDKVQAMANKLFSMLLAAELIVVLLDEFDELGRDRAGNENLLSRFHHDRDASQTRSHQQGTENRFSCSPLTISVDSMRPSAEAGALTCNRKSCRPASMRSSTLAERHVVHSLQFAGHLLSLQECEIS
jgi:SpoVK/Ycf46/Vps4 family AAA+-type ATPase